MSIFYKLPFTHEQNGDYSICFLWSLGLKDRIHAKQLAKYLAHNKYLINVTSHYLCIIVLIIKVTIVHQKVSVLILVHEQRPNY